MLAAMTLDARSGAGRPIAKEAQTNAASNIIKPNREKRRKRTSTIAVKNRTALVKRRELPKKAKSIRPRFRIFGWSRS
jgi:hypothetical protein